MDLIKTVSDFVGCVLRTTRVNIVINHVVDPVCNSGQEPTLQLETNLCCVLTEERKYLPFTFHFSPFAFLEFLWR
jgi:hypothetical protein